MQKKRKRKKNYTLTKKMMPGRRLAPGLQPPQRGAEAAEEPQCPLQAGGGSAVGTARRAGSSHMWLARMLKWELGVPSGCRSLPSDGLQRTIPPGPPRRHLLLGKSKPGSKPEDPLARPTEPTKRLLLTPTNARGVAENMMSAAFISRRLVVASDSANSPSAP